MGLYYHYSKDKEILFIYSTKDNLENIIRILIEKGASSEAIACIYHPEEATEDILRKYRIKGYKLEEVSKVRVFYKPNYTKRFKVIIFCYEEKYEEKVKNTISKLSKTTLSDILLGNLSLFNLPRVEYICKNFLNPLFSKLKSSGSLSYEDVEKVFSGVKGDKVSLIRETIATLSMAIVSKNAIELYQKLIKALNDFLDKYMKKENSVYIT